MVAIRLRREGTTNTPYYKVVVTDQRSPRDGKFIEIIGNYDPKKKDLNANIDLARADYWIGQGAKPSDTVRSLIKKIRKAAAPAAESARFAFVGAGGSLRPRSLQTVLILSAHFLNAEAGAGILPAPP